MGTKAENYIIGTRGSLLAVTQSGLIQRSLTDKTPHQFQLKKIVTRGDQETDKPLWQMDGKDFFTKELDSALLANDIDLVVHSYKDLGSERPPGIELAAITQRTYSEDILLIKKSTREKISDLKSITIGTSSPRRITNLKKELPHLIPGNAKIETKVLRGNVNGRIQKLKNDEYDAIVLALAGLERLAYEENSLKELEFLIDGLDFMLLPKDLFPAAASQGALGIEVHSGSEKYETLKSAISKVHCPKTENAVKEERKRFQVYGGGCHLPVGIHCHETEYGLVCFEKGETPDGQEVSTIEFLRNNKLDKAKSKNALVEDELIKQVPLNKSFGTKGKNLFVTSSYTFHAISKNEDYQSLWVSGSTTWKKLASQGRWIHGSACSLGHEEIKRFQDSRVVQLFMKNTPWAVLSHNSATSPIGECIGVYQHELLTPSEEHKKNVSETKVFYWSSPTQVNYYFKLFPELKSKDIQHCSGMGKTSTHLKDLGITPVVFYSKKDFTHWLNQ